MSPALLTGVYVNAVVTSEELMFVALVTRPFASTETFEYVPDTTPVEAKVTTPEFDNETSPVKVVLEATPALLPTNTVPLAKAVVKPLAQLKLPAPSVLNTWPLPPFEVGSVQVKSVESAVAALSRTEFEVLEL